MSTMTLMTAEEFAEMSATDTENYELIGGELIPVSSGTIKHNIIRDLIGHLLWSYFKRNPIGEAVSETSCRIAGDTVRQPDLSIFLGKRLQEMDRNRVQSPFAPDIAVEVLSPSEKTIDTRRKVRDYIAAGSEEVWTLDHANQEVCIHSSRGIRLLDADSVLESPLLPGFSVPVADLVVNV